MDALTYIGENLRKEDLDEVKASTEGDPVETLKASWAASDRSWLILDRTGLPIGAFGVAPAPTPGVGIVWLLGTSGIEREWIAVARQTRRHLEYMHEDFPVLWNFIDARNELSLQWLLRSGFHLIDADAAYGAERRLFFEFARTV
ncbi:MULTISPECIES: hypothetical protein [unclassified Sphingomonas]|uniref:hypothetical protein n=1 Tax=unclassified Sphingomonas TaxID=196159 RepID=UPI0021518DA0|nr:MULTISPECIES: hypothetical protein [unclassified Sphingomonas]MCR5870678.1 hypothetical protein [Sphingomonas sp. J344]UUY00986.1 hypothetical protein LRS08_08000 [Sphingomonas sp. J315]